MWSLLTQLIYWAAIIAAPILVWLVLVQLKRLVLKTQSTRKQVKTMIVLGSGGHTSEMFRFVSTLDQEVYSPRVYVIANTDKGSHAKVIAFESKNTNKKFSEELIPRSREVHQPMLSSVVSTLKAFLACVVLVFKTKPDVVLTNGPGTCVPVCVAAFIMDKLGVHRCRLVLSESYACVKHISMTAKILYYIVDVFCVQWPQLLKYKRAQYTGRLPLSFTKPSAGSSSSMKKSYVLVTVGSTKYDGLIEAVDDKGFIQKLKKLGFTGIHIQKGNGTYQPHNILDSTDGGRFDITVYDYKDTLKDEIDNAALIISHAGAGTTLDTLEAGRVMLAIPNDTLMAKHQTDIAQELSDRGYLYYCECNELRSKIDSFDFSAPRTPFPKTETSRYAQILDELLNIKKTK